jgi:hypothetical protein
LDADRFLYADFLFHLYNSVMFYLNDGETAI